MNRLKHSFHLSSPSPIRLVVIFLSALAFCYTFYLASTFVRYHDLGFNTDLARDFLLLENIVDTHKLPLIGPRSGGIPGIFHGPLWIYLNLPAFILGHGNPVTVGWFWIVLIALLVGITYVVGAKLYNSITGLTAALLVATLFVKDAAFLFNPFGAVLVYPLFFYTFYNYLQTSKVWYLVTALFLTGLLIQFQIAFGGPILMLMSVLTLYHIVRKRQFLHLLAFGILVIPFSTYFLFDLRHQFLELHALISYIHGDTVHLAGFTVSDMLLNRYDGFVSTLVAVSYPSLLLKLGIISLFGYLLVISLKTFRTSEHAKIVLLFAYFFLGFWAISFLFRGIIWGYYTWPFIPMSVILITSSYNYLHKYVSFVCFILIYLLSLHQAQITSQLAIQQTIGKDAGTWLFNQTLATSVFNDKEKRFGYYIFSPDQYGYSPRYAMNYVAKKYPAVAVSPYKKEQITYLLVSPPGGKDNGIGGEWWKEHKVKLQKTPVKTIPFANGFKIEKYELTPAEQAIASDPTIIDSILFR